MRALERMEDEGDIIATAFYSSPISLSNVPISRGDPTSLIIFNIFHAQVKLFTCKHFTTFEHVQSSYFEHLATIIFSTCFSCMSPNHLPVGFLPVSLCILLSLTF
jgi:hypothetical protein